MVDSMHASGESLRSKFRGALVGLAVGDAFGASFEGTPSVSAGQWARLVEDDKRLRFTDDTHMAFGVAESLIAHPDFDGAHMANVFVRDYEAEPWRGYGATPPKVFGLIKQGVPWDVAATQAFGGQGSWGNGAAMRVAPVALVAYPDLDRVGALARRTAIITHSHELGIEGAAVQACAVALALTQPPGQPIEPAAFLDALRFCTEVDDYRRRLDQILPLLAGAGRDEVVATLGHGIEAIEAVPAAICSFLAHRASFEDALAFAVSLGGDTDTIAAMAGAIAGAHLGLDAIPQSWRDRVEGASSMARVADGLYQIAHDRPDPPVDPRV